MVNEMLKKGNDLKNKSAQLENKANELNLEFENLKKSYDENITALNNMAKSNLEKLSEADLSSLESAVASISGNIGIIESRMAHLAKVINVVLSDFENARKENEVAKREYAKHKELFDKEEEVIKPQIESITKELLALEKGIDEKLLSKYKSKRQDKRFPIFVPLLNNSCGGCQMQLAYATISSIKENQVIECEHCRRFIYSN